MLDVEAMSEAFKAAKEKEIADLRTELEKSETEVREKNEQFVQMMQVQESSTVGEEQRFQQINEQLTQAKLELDGRNRELLMKDEELTQAESQLKGLRKELKDARSETDDKSEVQKLLQNVEEEKQTLKVKLQEAVEEREKHKTTA